MSSTAYTFKTDKIPIEAMLQDEHWYDAKGKLYKIANMDNNHARGAMRMLTKVYGVGSMSSPLYLALKDQSTNLSAPPRSRAQ